VKKVALITGVGGQAGSYLADLLLDKGYKVFGMERRSSTKNRVNTKHLEGKIEFLVGDLSDQNSLLRCLKQSNPDEVFNMAAQSFVGESWNTPEQTADITGLGCLRLLEAIREFNPKIKFLQCSSSEMYGKQTVKSANEETPFYPRSPYGVAKLYAFWITKNYRESYGMFCCNAIMFNYESCRRGYEFVTRKITDGVAKIYLGLADSITLGNLDSKRDWGYCPDYMEGVWLMLQHDTPDDYVLATNTVHSVRDFLRFSFESVGIEDWEKYVKVDPRFLRPAEVDYLRGDYSKAKRVLGWEPKTKAKEIAAIMVHNDIVLLSNK
jgi:GDPmannose 4,6-dehydratase